MSDPALVKTNLEPSTASSSPGQGQNGGDEKSGRNSAMLSSVELTKDDPNSSNTTLNAFAAHDTKYPLENEHPIYKRSLSIERFYSKYSTAFQKSSFGNNVFRVWHDKCSSHMPDEGDFWRHDEFVQPVFPSRLTFEQMAANLFIDKHNFGVWALDKLLKDLFTKPVPKEPFRQDDWVWEQRSFFLSLSLMCPTTFFDLEGQEAAWRDDKPYRFWDFSDEYNPRLIPSAEEPLTLMWTLSSMLFAHPWTGPSVQPPVVSMVEERRRLRQKAQANRLAVDDLSGQKRNAPATPDNCRRSSKLKDTKATPNREASTMDSTPGDNVDAIGVAPSAAKKQVSGGKSAVSFSDQLANKDDGLAASTAITPDRTDQHKSKAPSSSSNLGSEGPPSVLRHSAALTASTAESTECSSLTTDPVALSYKEAALTKPSPSRPLTNEEKIAEMTQPCVNGLPVKFAWIFNTNLGFQWEGQAASSISCHQVVYNSVRRFVEAMCSETGYNIHLLPFADARYKVKDNWIKSLADFDRLAPDWNALQLYLDPNFGNPYVVDQVDKIGKKVHKTRMRFGFNRPTAVVMKSLRSLLSHTGRGAGVFETPLQTSELACVGFLPMYPALLSKRHICKFLMREFGFKIAIGMMRDWIRNPRGQGVITFNQTSNRGLICWHIYCHVDHAEEVDRALRRLLHPNTPKQDFPYGCATQYVHDWQSASDDLLSVGAVPQLARLIGTMRERARVFDTMTDVVAIPLELHGMLNMVDTTHYGKISLLKLLYSIVVTPSQADKADQQEPSADQLIADAIDDTSDEELEDADSDTEMEGATAPTDNTSSNDTKPSSPAIWKQVVKHSSKSKDVSVFHSKKKAPSTPEEEAEWANDLLRIDLDNSNPGPLFIYILPTDGEDSYIVVVRRRYRALVENVLSNLSAFLKFHLREPSHAAFIRIIKHWMALDEAERNQRAHIEWFPPELRSRPKDEPVSAGVRVEDSLDFLNGTLDDPMDVVEGTLHIDTLMSSVKDIDDGATVAGALDELREAQEGLADALREVDRSKAENDRMAAQLRRQQEQMEAQAAQMAAMQRAFEKVQAAQAAQLGVARVGPSGGQESADGHVVQDVDASPSGEGSDPLAHGTDGGGGAPTSGPCFGDDHRVRAPGSSRIVFQNINGVPDDPEDHKQQLLQQWWQLECVDVVLLAEMNKYWPAVPQQSRWRERLRAVSSRGFHTVVAYNEHQRRRNHHNTSQYGGCSVSAFNQASHAVRSSGSDSLGRFSWIRFQGRRRRSSNGSALSSSSDLVVIAAYRPNPPSAGKDTVWYQQMAHFSRNDRFVDPREAFLIDLLEAVDGWIDEGCEVIVGLDANEDLSVADSKSFRGRMISSGLKEVILSRHRFNFQATYQRNNSNKPIDGIFATSGVSVLSAGYYPFDEHAPSDHRALWIDIDWEKILGRFHPSKQQFSPRRLTLDNQRVVENYLRLAEAEYQRFNIPGRLAGLMSTIYSSFGLTERQRRRFNRIHADAYTARRLAERKCRKLKMGGKPWSPKGQDLWDRIALWRILLKGRRNCRVSSRKVRRLMQKVGEPMAWTLSTAELEARLSQARSAHRALHRTDTPRQWRRDHLSVTVASAKKARLRSSRHSSKSAQLAQIKQREETRRRRKARGKGFSGGLRAIQVDCSSTTQCITITEKNLVEDGCMRENTARYQQTFTPYPTPPMVPPLYPLFSGSQARTNSERLLQGDFHIPTSLDRSTRSFLRQCRYRHGTGTQPLGVTLENHVEFWSKMPETKGSEPHGLHNGHFKAGVQSEMLASCDAAFREIPISTGFVPDQWKHLMNFAIEKQPGDFRLSKMRTIQMMNSEFQANNKLIGKTSMSYAEHHSIIPPGQCGARKHHQAKDLALSKRLIWDSLILDRQAAGWVSNDAKSCFDRIVHWVGKLAMMRFGIPWEAVSMIFDTLAEAKHRVRTGYGDSPRIFEPSSSIPFQGCGQGNGAGPAIWVAISAILIDMMDAEGFGYSSRTALSDEEIFASCFSFIDDTDVIHSGDLTNSGEELLPSISSALTLWAGGVRASGGAINPDKSFWWLIDFEWMPSGRWRFRSPQEMPGELRLAGLSGELETLRRLAPAEAERTLGVMMAPLETGNAQLLALLDKARDWANSLRPQHIMPYDVFPLIRSTIMKSLEYPMALTTLSLKEWLRIMSPILLRCLPKAGVCRNFPRVVVFAPLKFQGLGLPHPLSLQVFHHLSMLLRHSVNPSKTSDYLLSVLESHQLETGSSFGLLQQQFDNTGILASDTWLKRVWRQLDNLDIRVEFSHPPLDLHREGDQLLVDLFVDALVDQDVLLWLNWCRVYLQATTVSDLLTADGRFITLSAWTGYRSNSVVSEYNWPRTVRPASNHWDTWRSVLTQTLLRPHTSNRRVKLKLGPWTDSLTRWRWLFSPSRKSLFRKTGDGWLCYRPISRRNKSTFCLSCRPWNGPPPPDSLRSTVDIQAGTEYVVISGLDRIASPAVSLPTSRSILDIWNEWRIECTPTWGWVPDHLHIEGSEEELLQDLIHHRLRIVSDGSFKGDVVDEGIGTAATQLRSRSGRSSLWLRTRTPGHSPEMSPYRSELTGIFSGVLALSWLCSLVPKPSSPFHVRPACDGLEALRLSFGTWPLSGTEADFDLVSSIRAVLRDLPVRCSPRHVKGHADRYKSWSQMTWWERRNFEVDHIAQEYADELLRGPASPPVNPKFFSEPCAVFLGERKLSSLSLAALDEAVVLPDLKAYWADRGRPSDTFDLVHWPTVERAMKALPPGLQRWTTKHTVGMCGVGKFRVHWGLDLVNQCPLCRQPEDHHHVPRCTAPSAQLQWSKSILHLQSWMDRSSTAPVIATFLLALLSNVRGHHPIPPLLWYQSNGLDISLLSTARDEQLRVGPQGLLEGLLVSHWATLQQSHFRSRGSRRSATLWAAQLSQQLLLVGHQMWIHRNEVFHSDDSAASLQLRTDLDRRIEEQFRLGVSNLPAIVHPMLQPSLKRSILQYSNDDKSDWLAILVRARRQARRSLAAQRSLLWAYFHPAEP